MRRMVHRNSDGFIQGTTTIYEDGEGPSLGEILAPIWYGVIALIGFAAIYRILEPFLQ